MDKRDVAVADSPVKRVRCSWATDESLCSYHDDEWGQHPDSDARWFEFIVLETFQAGLSWRTILHKRAAFRQAFRNFDPEEVAAFGNPDFERLLADSMIVRNRKKIVAAVDNAKIACALVERHGALGAFLTGLRPEEVLDVLCDTFRFVGRTTAESIAYATGLLPAPHDPTCWKSASVQG